MRPMLAQLPSYDGDAWVDWSWVDDHRDDIVEALRSHATVTLQVVALGVPPDDLIDAHRLGARGEQVEPVPPEGVPYSEAIGEHQHKVNPPSNN